MTKRKKNTSLGLPVSYSQISVVRRNVHCYLEPSLQYRTMTEIRNHNRKLSGFFLSLPVIEFYGQKSIHEQCLIVHLYHIYIAKGFRFQGLIL